MSKNAVSTTPPHDQTFNAIHIGTSISVAAAAAHAESAAVDATTTVVQLIATVASWIDIGPTPVATTGKMYIPALVPVLVGINPGEKVSALRVGGSDGTVYITQGA